MHPTKIYARIVHFVINNCTENLLYGFPPHVCLWCSEQTLPACSSPGNSGATDVNWPGCRHFALSCLAVSRCVVLMGPVGMEGQHTNCGNSLTALIYAFLSFNDNNKNIVRSLIISGSYNIRMIFPSWILCLSFLLVSFLDPCQPLWETWGFKGYYYFPLKARTKVVLHSQSALKLGRRAWDGGWLEQRTGETQTQK